MWLSRSPRSLRTLVHLRPFSQAAAAFAREAPWDPTVAPLEYLEGFPRPDPKHAETILAIPRESSGKNISAKERKVRRVPSIVFEQANGQEGGNKRLISVQDKQIRKPVLPASAMAAPVLSHLRPWWLPFPAHSAMHVFCMHGRACGLGPRSSRHFSLSAASRSKSRNHQELLG